MRMQDALAASGRCLWCVCDGSVLKLVTRVQFWATGRVVGAAVWCGRMAHAVTRWA